LKRKADYDAYTQIKEQYMKSRAKFVTSLFSLIAISASGVALADHEKFGQKNGQQLAQAGRLQTTSSITSQSTSQITSQVTSADFDDFAKVINVVAQVEQVNRPRQECRTEIVQVNRQVQTNAPPQQRSNGGAIIGGIAGALIGNQVGGGSGRTTATAAGAIIGALSGDRLDNNNAQAATETISSEQPVQRCRMVDHIESRTNGYNVTYEYRGRQYSTILANDPGNRLKVNVTVTPAQ
jgi:uncharacterized protein YcfJ